jgi:hypothetical protein
MPRVTLPTLKRLMFRGVAVYLENLVAQINTPLLEQLTVTLFFELEFTLIALTKFIITTGGLSCLSAKVLFKKEGVSIVTNNGKSLSSGGLTINVNCEHLDWQIDAATQCCGALEQFLSAVEELVVDLDKGGMPSNWDDSLDSVLWHGLLLPFSSLKKLQIGSSLTYEVSNALKLDAAGLGSSLLPALQKLEVHPEFNDAETVFSTFIETRELGGHPVELLVLSPFDSLFNTALRNYAKQTGLALEHHPLAKKLENCDSVDSIMSVLQDYIDDADLFQNFTGDHGKFMRPMKYAVYAFFTLSSALGEAVAQVCPKPFISTPSP